MDYLIWTRSRDDWPDDSKKLEDFKVLHLPCLQTVPLNPPMPQKVYGLCVITSGKAAALIDADSETRDYVNQCQVVITFGPQTAARCKAFHNEVVLVQNVHNADQLTEHIINHHAGESVVYLGPKDPAYPMADVLKNSGFKVEHISLYETECKLTHSNGGDITGIEIDQWSQQWIHRGDSVVAFASPSAVEGFSQRFFPKYAELKTNLTAVAIGKTTAYAAEKYFDRIKIASDQTIDKLIETIRTVE